MSIAKRIAANRANKERGFVDVEEWGEEGKPLRLFFTQVSARDIEKVQRKHKDFLSNTTMSAMVDMMIEKCEDEAGERAFTLEDKPVLMGETSVLLPRSLALYSRLAQSRTTKKTKGTSIQAQPDRARRQVGQNHRRD
jgi:hypothetical protein